MVEVQRLPGTAQLLAPSISEGLHTDSLVAPVGRPVQLTEAADLYQPGYPGKFDPTLHIAYEAPSRSYTLTELGLDPSDRKNKSNAVAVKDFAYTEPFRLLSAAGVEAVRSELFSKKVLDNCVKQVVNQHGDPLKYFSVRNPGKVSSFLLDIWRSPDMQEKINHAVGGYELVPTMNHECSHANLQIPTMQIKKASDGWHTDGNAQIVMVMMLSDPRGLIGGDTEVRCGDGSIRSVKWPGPGFAMMMQGMIVNHNVQPVMTANGEIQGERLTMVTSYQPASYKELQQSVVGYLRAFSDEDQLLTEWAEWRFTVMSKRLADAAQQLEEWRKQGKFDLKFARGKAAEMREFLAVTEQEMVDMTISDVIDTFKN